MNKKCNHSFTDTDELKIQIADTSWKKLFSIEYMPFQGRVCTKCGLVEFYLTEEQLRKLI